MPKTKGELLVKKWIKALRSGKYKQGNVYLASIDKDKEVTRYCVLGVLCDVAVKEGLLKAPKRVHKLGNNEDKLFFEGYDQSLPPKLRKLVGLRTSYGVYHTNMFDYLVGHSESLTGMNDSGKKFTTLAKIIESKPRGLFEGKN